MSHSWFRLYDEVADDPKVQLLSDRLFKAWINFMCIANKNAEHRGALPAIEHVAYRLHMTTVRVESLLKELVSAGLFEWRDGVAYSHNWDKRQFSSDGSAERMRRLRQRHSANESDAGSDVTSDVTVTRHELRYTESDTETESENPIVPLLVFGEFGRVQLTAGQHEKLKAKLSSHFDDYVARFDGWVQEAPDAKANGVKRKNREAYASIQNWFNRDVKEGKVKTASAGMVL